MMPPPQAATTQPFSIESLEKEKQQVHQFISKADAAQHIGKISAPERDAIVAHYYGTADARVILGVYDDRIAALKKQPPEDDQAKKTTLLIAGFSLLVIAMFATLFYTTGGLTGAVVYEAGGNPSLIRPIPDISAIGSAWVDVSAAFQNPNNEPLAFEWTRHDGLAETLDNGILTVTGAPGTYTYVTYAGDGHGITPSNIFTITLREN